MGYNSVADRYEFYAGSFTFDFYIQALRRFVKLSALSGGVGNVETTPIDPFFLNERPLALLLGESNRLYVRYPIVKELMDSYKAGMFSSTRGLSSTKYYKYLYSNFESRSLLARFRGKKSCIVKTKRVLKICDWLERTSGDFSGLSSYISGGVGVAKPDDFPLTIKIDNAGELNSFVQLDGSHRRSVAAFLGYNEVSSMVVDLDALNEYIKKCDDEYILKYWPVVVNLLDSLKLVDLR